MGRVLIAVAVTLIVAASAFAQTGDVARGEKLYTSEKCMVCHAIGGKGNARGALDGVGSKLSAEDIRLWLVDPQGMTAKTKAARRPVMRDYKHLSTEDIDGLVAYMLSLKK
jgi:mono/diheme cytochrome c family protein